MSEESFDNWVCGCAYCQPELDDLDTEDNPPLKACLQKDPLLGKVGDARSYELYQSGHDAQVVITTPDGTEHVTHYRRIALLDLFGMAMENSELVVRVGRNTSKQGLLDLIGERFKIKLGLSDFFTFWIPKLDRGQTAALNLIVRKDSPMLRGCVVVRLINPSQ